MRCYTVCASAIAMVISFATPGDASAQSIAGAQNDQVSFLDSSPLVISVAGDRAKVDVEIANPSKSDAMLSVFILGDRRVEIIPLSDPAIGSLQVRKLRLQFIVPTINRSTGLLKLSATRDNGITAGTSYRRITFVDAFITRYLSCVVFGSLIVGVVIATIGAATSGFRLTEFSTKMGIPAWDFSTSWASNFTAAGAAFGTALTLAVLPEPLFSAIKNEYLAVYVLFLTLVGAAPYLYNAVRRIAFIENAAGSKTLVYYGYAGMFLVSATVTCWGVIGQLFALMLILSELQRFEIWPITMVVILSGITVALLISLVLYLIASISANLKWGRFESNPIQTGHTSKDFSEAAPETGGLTPKRWAVL